MRAAAAGVAAALAMQVGSSNHCCSSSSGSSSGSIKVQVSSSTGTSSISAQVGSGSGSGVAGVERARQLRSCSRSCSSTDRTLQLRQYIRAWASTVVKAYRHAAACCCILLHEPLIVKQRSTFSRAVSLPVLKQWSRACGSCCSLG
jgi:hypothetical protein